MKLICIQEENIGLLENWETNLNLSLEVCELLCLFHYENCKQRFLVKDP